MVSLEEVSLAVIAVEVEEVDLVGVAASALSKIHTFLGLWH